MKKILLLLLLVSAGISLYSQIDPRIAPTLTPLSQVPQIVMPPLDNKALLTAEMERRGPGIAPKFAENIEVNISPATAGHWEYLPDGHAVWRVKIVSTGAKSINLGFSKYFMPAGGTLVLYTPDFQHILGPFTPSDNEAHEQLWTPVIPGDALIIEIQLPQHSQSALQAEVRYVNHDFLGFAELLSGACNLDVICGASDGWDIVDNYRDIIRSVALIGTNGSTFCTGFLVNNARQDCTPFFMTAFHCGINAGNAPSLVAYWNYENSTCRQPGSSASGGPGNGLLNNFNTGAIFRSGWQPSDFTLVELDDSISVTANAFFAGWNAEDAAPSDTVLSIHHPSTDEKRISFEFDQPLITDINGNPSADGNYLKVPDWDIGTTEGGSSGAPLFNRNKRVVGQLYGGLAACNNNDYDVFGRFSRSWTGGGTPGTRLRDWLDPDNTGILVLDGRSQLQCSFFADVSPTNFLLCTPDSAVFDIDVSENFEDEVTLSLINLPAGLTATFENNPVPPGGSTILTITDTDILAAGNYMFQLQATDGANTSFTDLSLRIETQVPGMLVLETPLNNASGEELTPVFSWIPQTASIYTIEISADESFTNIIEAATDIPNGSYELNVPLEVLTTYFWRVKAENICGEGPWSEVYQFTTGAVYCLEKTSGDVPKVISAVGTPSITSTLEINTVGAVTDVNVLDLRIDHTWVGDLVVELTSPSGTTITLMSSPGNGQCQNNNVHLYFDDESPNGYAILDNMCEVGPLAISGSYQPLGLLSAFDGEPAFGTWTLTVHDNVNEDGGTLQDWGLEICTIIPNDFSLSSSEISFETCLNEEINFTLLSGTAFDPAGIMFTAAGLPPGTDVTFEPVPASPGAEVMVTVSGISSPGTYNFTITGSDGVDTGSIELEWIVSGLPEAPSPISPAPNEINVTLNKVFSWTSLPGATYNLEIATGPDMTPVVFSAVTNSTSLNVTGLQSCQNYFWTVTAMTECGESQPSEIFAFTTVADLAFNINPAIVPICNLDSVSAVLTLGDCFEAGGVTLSASTTGTGISFNFPANPVEPGSQAGFGILTNNTVPGTYSVEITGTDGVNTVSETFILQVKAPAAVTTLTQPADQAVMVDFENPVFKWLSVPGAATYNFELSTDENFTSIIHQASLSQTSYTLPLTLNGATAYFWRVTALNNCGGTTPAPFRFTTETEVPTIELQGMHLEILPNPTSGLIYLNFSSAISEAVEVTIFATNGVRLGAQVISAGTTGAVVDISEHPAGIYWLRLKSGPAVLTKKIVLKK